jgi:hypothetical protein
MHRMCWTLIGWIAATLPTALSAGLSAQQPNTSTATTTVAEKPQGGREILVQNLAPFARRQPVAVVVPFAPGVAFEPPRLTVNDLPTTWQPFGARWPDGSWRQATCMFVAQLPRLSEIRFPILAGHTTIEAKPIQMPDAKIHFVVRRGKVVERVEPVRVRDLEKNAMRRVELRRARIGKSGLVAELIVTAWRKQRHADIALAVFYSDPTSKRMQCNIDELAVECHGMGIVLRHSGYLGVQQGMMPYGSRTVLLQKRALGDGQGLRRVGAMVPPLEGDKLSDSTLRAVIAAPLLAATTWRQTGAFGPFGVVPAPPPWLAGNALRRHFATRHKLFVRRERPGGDPLGVGPHGLQRMAGQTGDQEDFGTCKLSGVAWSGIPSMLLEVEASVLQEACRPVHFFEADASPVDPAKHPKWIVWSGRTHWHKDVSLDRLGKPHPEPAFASHGWTGKDRQHWSSNYLSAYALLTGAHWARLELANEARLYLAGQTLDPKFTTSNRGAPRGAGRVALTAAWNLCVTDNELLRERMDQRVDRIYYKKWPLRNAKPERVRPMATSAPDPRLLGGMHAFWNPWQDAIAAVGFAAHHRMTGNARARELAEILAVNVVRHGWLRTERINEVGMAIRWLKGNAFTEEQWRSRDQTLVQWSQGTLYSEWSIGAVEIARVVAERDGDEQLLKKATSIQLGMRKSRKRPSRDYPYLGGFDRFGEWDATAWLPK